jgi:hypothetical protein
MIVFVESFLSVLWSPQRTAMHHPRNAGGVEVKTFLSKRGGLAPGA